MGEEAKRSPHYIMCVTNIGYKINAIVEEADTQEVGLDKQQVDLDEQAQLV